MSKEMKLEIEHLIAYYPYELRLQNIHNGKIDVLRSIVDGPGYDDVKIKIGYEDAEHIWMFKPVLKPLSDYNDSLANDEIANTFVRFISVKPDYFSLDDEGYNVVQILAKHHVDVFGLIPAGLAVSK